jgi:hypothetical protein
MIALEPECLLPGHGLPVVGADRVRQALTDTAELLEALVDQTLQMMNRGGRPRPRPRWRRVFSARADAATSTMARGIFTWAARDGG